MEQEVTPYNPGEDLIEELRHFLEEKLEPADPDSLKQYLREVNMVLSTLIRGIGDDTTVTLARLQRFRDVDLKEMHSHISQARADIRALQRPSGGRQ